MKKVYYDIYSWCSNLRFKIWKITSGFTLTERWEAGNYHIIFWFVTSKSEFNSERPVLFAWCLLFLEFLENSWNFIENFLSALETNPNLPKNSSYDCTFCIFCRLDCSYRYCRRNYLMSLCFCQERIWGWLLEKINSLPWGTPGKLLDICHHQSVNTMCFLYICSIFL